MFTRMLRLKIGILLTSSSLALLASPALAQDDPEASSSVALTATIFATFSASPTLNPTDPDLFGGTNSVVETGLVDELGVSESFREIYEGTGESGTSLFEFEFDGYASLAEGGTWEVDLLAVDQNNASATRWTVSGVAYSYRWLELSGPTDASGNYVVGFTTSLGAFTAANTQPPGFTSIWRANGETVLTAEPLDSAFRVLNLSAFATLTEGCASLAAPPCFGHARLLSASGQVTVPGTNPRLRIAHSVSASGRSVEIHTAGASLEMDLPDGVVATAYQPVPEPSASLAIGTALVTLGAARASRRRTVA